MYIVVLPYTERSRMFHHAVEKKLEAYIGEGDRVVYFEHMAKPFDLDTATKIRDKQPNTDAFIKPINPISWT